jgi:predicted nucleic acid-binding Zn ribbon protein
MGSVNEMNKRSEAAAHISGVLADLLKRLRPEAKEGMLRIRQVWDRVVEEDTARNARPAAFKGSILLVQVTGSAWIHHLQFQRKELISRLNADFGKTVVTDIKFKVGSF